MFSQWKSGKWVVVAGEAYRMGVSYVVDYLDARQCLGDAKSTAGKDFLV